MIQQFSNRPRASVLDLVVLAGTPMRLVVHPETGSKRPRVSDLGMVQDEMARADWDESKAIQRAYERAMERVNQHALAAAEYHVQRLETMVDRIADEMAKQGLRREIACWRKVAEKARSNATRASHLDGVDGAGSNRPRASDLEVVDGAESVADSGPGSSPGAGARVGLQVGGAK